MMKQARFEKKGTIELNKGEELKLNIEINLQNTTEDKLIYLPKLKKICEETLKGLIKSLLESDD